ncbi:MAG: glycosyltransferase family 2 protein [Granulicella sp.]
MTNALVGIVTVTYNGAEVLPDFLHCLFAQTHTNFLLFVIDNASHDKTIELLRGCHDSRVIVFENRDNRGVAEGNNQGIRSALEAGCSRVLLVNNDVEFGETLLEELVTGLETYQCDMVCPKMLYFEERERIWAAGGFFQPRFGYRSLHYGKDEIDRGQFDETRKITYAPTCCVLIRVELFEKIGLMDARYFAYVDDTDFMYRALKADSKLFYLADSKLFHKIGHSTGGGDSPFSIMHGARNHAFFALKHFGRIKGRFWILTHRLYYLVKLLSLKDNLATFKMKQLAINEAFCMLQNDLRSSGIQR